jgi:hypothetical protein
MVSIGFSGDGGKDKRHFKNMSSDGSFVVMTGPDVAETTLP